MSFEVKKHLLVPKHTKASDSETKLLLEKYKIQVKSLPKIFNTDSAIAGLDVKAGDIIKIERESKTAGTSIYYRVVVDE